MLNISNFHGKALREKYMFPFFFVVYLVKLRHLKKGIAKKLQTDPMFELLALCSLNTKRSVWANSPLFVVGS